MVHEVCLSLEFVWRHGDTAQVTSRGYAVSHRSSYLDTQLFCKDC